MYILCAYYIYILCVYYVYTMCILCIYYSLAIVLWQQAIPPSPLPPSLFFPICQPGRPLGWLADRGKTERGEGGTGG